MTEEQKAELQSHKGHQYFPCVVKTSEYTTGGVSSASVRPENFAQLGTPGSTGTRQAVLSCLPTMCCGALNFNSGPTMSSITWGGAFFSLVDRP